MLDAQTKWHDFKIKQRAAEGPKPTAFGTPFRISDAGACIRKRTFSAFGAVESEEFSPQTYMAFTIGTSVHEDIQAALAEGGDDWEFAAEVPIDLTEATKVVSPVKESFGLSGHCDGIITDQHGTRTVAEFKTVSGFAAKLAWSAGPKREHWAQAALYAVGVDADFVTIVYVSKEADWRAGIKAGEMRQWERGLYEVDEDTGLSLYDLALEELRHFQHAARYFHRRQIAPAFVPDDNGELRLIHERPEYMAKQGEWRCRYCNYNTTCRSLPEDEVPVEMIERVQPANNKEV